MQRHHHVIARGFKGADPILRGTCPGIAHQARTRGGSGDEGAEGLEGECRDAIFDLECDQSGPGDAHVKAVVRLVARGSGEDRLLAQERSPRASLLQW